MDKVLLITLLVPFIGAGLVQVCALSGRQLVRRIALATTLVTLVLTVVLAANFPHDGNLQESGGSFASSSLAWLGGDSGIDVRLSVGLDGLSLWLFVLSSVLMVTALLSSWEAIKSREASFYSLLLLLECGCLGVFAARDLLLFYVFFEFTLIPLFFLIGIWGSENRRYAAIKFFLYTLAGSLLTFLGLVTIVVWHYLQIGTLTFSIPELTEAISCGELSMPFGLQLAIFLALFAGFAIKVPLFPFHTWLPLAHVQAPTAGSVFLAGILLKMGTYGFLRFSVPMLPDATAACVPWILWLAVVGIVYGALVALAQQDMKKLIAYSSVSHLGYCMLGMFALNPLGVTGSVLQMINHGISTGALFALVGMLYERYHTRDIKQFGGLARRLPIFSFFFVLFVLSSIGLPGLNGFTGEIMILLGMFLRACSETGPANTSYLVITALAVSGLVLGAWYMLWLVQRLLFGPVRTPDAMSSEAASEIKDLQPREIAALAPLAVLVVVIGIWPSPLVDRMKPTLDRLTTSAQSKLGPPEKLVRDHHNHEEEFAIRADQP